MPRGDGEREVDFAALAKGTPLGRILSGAWEGKPEEVAF